MFPRRWRKSGARWCHPANLAPARYPIARLVGDGDRSKGQGNLSCCSIPTPKPLRCPLLSQAELLALMLAGLVLATTTRWPMPVPFQCAASETHRLAVLLKPTFRGEQAERAERERCEPSVEHPEPYADKSVGSTFGSLAPSRHAALVHRRCRSYPCVSNTVLAPAKFTPTLTGPPTVRHTSYRLSRKKCHRPTSPETAPPD